MLSKKGDSEPAVLFTSKTIKGKKGGTMILDVTYVTDEGRELEVYVKLEIPKRAFHGTSEISFLPNPEDATIQFFPHMAFDKPVKIKYRIKGLDLEEMGYTHGNHDFAFFSDEGETEIIDCSKSHVNLNKNEIKVQNAKLDHFSRYGWIRSTQ